MSQHFQLLITSPKTARVWAMDTLEAAERRLDYMVRFYEITHIVTEIDEHRFEARCEEGITKLELKEIEGKDHE